MHALRVGVEADDGVVEDQADHRERDGAADDVAGGRVASEVAHRDLRHEGRARRQGADVLRRLVGRAGSRLAQALDHGIEQGRGHPVPDLDLELAKARRRLVVEDGHRVVDHAADEAAARSRADRCVAAAWSSARSARAPRRGRTRARARSHGPAGVAPFPSNTISGRTRNGASRSAGSFTVQPSPGRWRRLAPQRASRRSARVVVRRRVALRRRAPAPSRRRVRRCSASGIPRLRPASARARGCAPRRLRVASSPMALDDEKRRAAEAAAELVEHGMVVGLGTGSTVAHLLAALARRGLDLRCVATSPATEAEARRLGLAVETFSGTERAGPSRHRDRRCRPGRPRGLAREGRRRGAHAREGRRGRGRPLRGRRRLEQARRSGGATRSARARRVRARRDARTTRIGGAQRRRAQPGRRRHRRLHR